MKSESDAENTAGGGCSSHDLLCCPFCGFDEPEIGLDQNWCANCGARGPSDLDAWGHEGEPGRPRSTQAAWNTRRDERWSIEGFKAATNTLMSALVRKWEAEGTRCGEEGRNSDDAWDDDGDEWRERRAVYFECAEELKAALRKFSKHNDSVMASPPNT